MIFLSDDSSHFLSFYIFDIPSSLTCPWEKTKMPLPSIHQETVSTFSLISSMSHDFLEGVADGAIKASANGGRRRGSCAACPNSRRRDAHIGGGKGPAMQGRRWRAVNVVSARVAWTGGGGAWASRVTLVSSQSRDRLDC